MLANFERKSALKMLTYLMYAALFRAGGYQGENDYSPPDCKRGFIPRVAYNQKLRSNLSQKRTFSLANLVRGQVVTFILSLCFLNACGFHLHKTRYSLGEKYPTLVFALSGTNTLHQALYRALVASDIHVVEVMPPNQTFPQLKIVSQETSQYPLVYGPDGELRRERLTMRVTFAFSGKNHDEIELITKRDRQLNSKQHLGDNAEKVLIEQEMQTDIINQLLSILAKKNS